RATGSIGSPDTPGHRAPPGHQAHRTHQAPGPIRPPDPSGHRTHRVTGHHRVTGPTHRVYRVTVYRAVVACRSPGRRTTASSSTLAVSTQTMAGHSSSPKSAMAAALSTHGFHTTVFAEPSFVTPIERAAPSSRTITSAAER